MVYTTFSTDNADYVLQLGNHVTENKQVDIFEGIDALILETGEGSLEDYLENDPRYELSLQYCADNNTPVFGTDVAPTLSGSLRGRISFTPAVLLGPFASQCAANSMRPAPLLPSPLPRSACQSSHIHSFEQ